MFNSTYQEYKGIVNFYCYRLRGDEHLPYIDFCRPMHVSLEEAFEIPFCKIPLALREYDDVSIENIVLKFRLELGK